MYAVRDSTTATKRRSKVVSSAACLLLSALSLTAAPLARAATIDTYDFTQGGYTFGGSPNLTAVLTGRFTGNVESSGFIEIADLSSINVTFTTTIAFDGVHPFPSSGPATFFSFDTAQVSGSLDFDIGLGNAGSVICVGGVAAFGFDACGSGGVNGFVTTAWTTQSVPVVSLVSSVTTAPEIPIWAMMLVGLAVLGFLGFMPQARPRTAASPPCPL
ncbi:MAG: hypothetical protein JOY52_11795 [Hyphomicrobiales bacterium]|nr:hypothetical protein [Hyphomicrobiales bacterium]